MYLCLLLIFDFYLLLICVMLWLFAANKDVYIIIIYFNKKQYQFDMTMMSL